MDINITLSSNKTITSDGLVRLQVWVSEATNCPPEVFLIRILPISPESDHEPWSFARVCTYADLLNYSTAPDDLRRHYRVSSLDLLFTSIKEANEFEAVLANNADHLCQDIVNVTDATPVTTDTTI